MKYIIARNDHDGEGWYFPMGKEPMEEEKAKEAVMSMRYAHMMHVDEFGCYDCEPEIVAVTESEVSEL